MKKEELRHYQLMERAIRRYQVIEYARILGIILSPDPPDDRREWLKICRELKDSVAPSWRSRILKCARLIGTEIARTPQRSFGMELSKAQLALIKKKLQPSKA